MFPIQDTVAKRYPPTVTWLLILVNAVVFLYQVSLPPPLQESFIHTFALVPARFFGSMAVLRPPEGWSDYLPFLSNIFLHGGWLHLILNMWTLWIFAPAVEDRLGSLVFLLFYLVCGIAASLAHALVNASSTVPALGASGAIAGIIGCYVRLFPFARLVTLVPILFFPVFIEIYAIFYAFFWFITQIIPGLFSLLVPASEGGIAWWAHIGGFVAGWMLAPTIRKPARSYRRFYDDEGCYGFFPNGCR
ncbi:MAG: rhomboid family intramembrane serine protease [candidate division KSB1 bacterium]|nr:rhomboid family intramembrane serine protease [candidate division KSB1 bacterium]MDZ7347075.1 rhomboid family intramembrane serine protease [candidate division KSB1 bacterium]